ncbi:MAG: hypothetical protein ACXV5H_05465 [Halobacteriota archaeon]
MTTKAPKTSKSTYGDFAEVLYNEDEVQSYAGRIEEMSIDQVRRLLRDSGMGHLIDNCVDDPERPYTRSRTEFNLILPERDFSSLLERLSAVEHAITNGDRRQESTRDPSTLSFTREELARYTAHRIKGLASKSQDWIRRADEALWAVTQGAVSEESMTALRDYTLTTYTSVESHKKILSFATAFLKFLSKTTFNQQFQAYAVFLELPKTVKVRKAVTGRIVTIDDIRNVLAYITRAYEEGRINEHRYHYYSAFVIFGALTGQRSESTIAHVTVGQFRDALRMAKPVLRVEPEQDKIRLGHEVPLHPCVVESVKPLLEDRRDDEKAFEYISFLMWVKREKIPMSRFSGHFVLGDLRKFAEQHGDVIGWEQSNRAYILTHGVSGVDWTHYRHPLPEHVYDVYMRYWADVRF